MYPLLRMLVCDRVAPLGNPVVPDVYWMLIGSAALRDEAISDSRCSSAGVSTIVCHCSDSNSTTSRTPGVSGRTCSSMPA